MEVFSNEWKIHLLISFVSCVENSLSRAPCARSARHTILNLKTVNNRLPLVWHYGKCLKCTKFHSNMNVYLLVVTLTFFSTTTIDVRRERTFEPFLEEISSSYSRVDWSFFSMSFIRKVSFYENFPTHFRSTFSRCSFMEGTR